MWLLLPTGFYSAVQDRKDDRVMQVRARSKDDALALAKWMVAEELVELGGDYPTVESLVLQWPGRDYPYRVLMWREDWAAFVYYAAMGIDYGNFKDEVKKRQGARRASIYGRVWGVLLDVSREHQPVTPPKPRTGSYAGYSGYSLFDELHDVPDTPGWLVEKMDAARTASASAPAPGDTDERCPRCDKFISEVGLDAEGDCKKCKAELDDAIEDEDWDKVQAISIELGLVTE